MTRMLVTLVALAAFAAPAAAQMKTNQEVADAEKKAVTQANASGNDQAVADGEKLAAALVDAQAVRAYANGVSDSQVWADLYAAWMYRSSGNNWYTALALDNVQLGNDNYDWGQHWALNNDNDAAWSYYNQSYYDFVAAEMQFEFAADDYAESYSAALRAKDRMDALNVPQ